jgi:2-amino-4-hydroxy-6-hydroxymethyldihydropteridine diphosphokinase
MAETVYLLLGSNLGDRKAFLDKARDRLASVEGLEVVAVSPVYVTEAKEMKGEAPSFLNQAVKAEYSYNPGELLSATEGIEREFGRTEKGDMTPRTIDIDILLFGTRVVGSERLTVPHRKLLKRPFAMVPLLDIDSEIVHPGTGKPIAASLKDSDRKDIILYEDYVARSL